MVGTKNVGLNDAAKKSDFLKKYLEEKRCAMTRELEMLGIDRSTLLRLLRALEREGAVKKRKVGRVVLWCAAGP